MTGRTSQKGTRPIDYEQQTDDPEVLDLLAGVKDVLGDFAQVVDWETRRAIERKLRAVIWRTLME